jgi:hypothetical protein
MAPNLERKHRDFVITASCALPLLPLSERNLPCDMSMRQCIIPEIGSL